MSFLQATVALTSRSLRQIPRVPADFVVALVLPMFFFFLYGVGFSAIAQVPGFPSENYAAFILPQILVFTVFVSANGAGYGLVLEVKNGYLDKLLATPVPRSSILLGRFLAVAARCSVQVLLVLAVAAVFGLRPVTGLAGVPVMVLITALLAVAWAGVGATVALTTRSPEATEGLVILFLPLLYVSTAAMPFDLLPDGFRAAARANPITYVIEGLRAMTLDGFDLGAVLAALGAGAGLAVVTVTAATWALRRMDA